MITNKPSEPEMLGVRSLWSKKAILKAAERHLCLKQAVTAKNGEIAPMEANFASKLSIQGGKYIRKLMIACVGAYDHLLNFINAQLQKRISSKMQFCTNTKLQKCRFAKRQNRTNAKIHLCTNAKLQKCKTSKVQNFKSAKLQKCKTSKVHECTFLIQPRL